MKLLILVTVCFSAVAATDSSDFNIDPEGLDTSGEDDLYLYRNVLPFDDPDDHTFATEGQDSASGQEIQDSAEQDYEDNVDVHQQIGDMSELLGRARRCRKSLGGRCQNKKHHCKKGYKASPKGRPFCMSKHRICCYPGPKTTAAPTTTPTVTTPEPTTTTKTTTTTSTTTSTTTALTTTAKDKSCPDTKVDAGQDQVCSRKTGSYTWQQAVDYCKGIGLSLAQPKHLLNVATKIVEKTGNGWYWIGGKGTGSHLRLLNGTVLDSRLPAWQSGYPKTSTSDCLVIWCTTSHVKAGTILRTFECTNPSGYVICE